MKSRAQPLQFALWGRHEAWAALRAIVTGRIGRGAQVEAFRHAIGTLYAPSTVLPVNAGRTALRLALAAFAARRPERRRVLLPAYLCPSAVEVVRALGLEPYPVAVGSDLNLDPDHLAFDDRVLAVVAAHMYACPARIGEIERRCQAAGVFLIDDAAQVAGVRSEGRLLGTFGDIGVLSFAQSKTLVTGIRGSGGVLLINNPELQAELLQAHAGLSPPENRLIAYTLFVVDYLLSSRLGSAGYYLSRIIQALLPTTGRNPYLPAQLSNLEAGIARAQLARLAEILAARIRVADLYATALGDLPAIAMPQYAPGRFVSRFFIQLQDPVTAAAVRRGLHERMISTRAAYPPWSKDSCTTGASSMSDRLVELPSRPQMTAADVAQIAESLRQIVSRIHPTQ